MGIQLRLKGGLLCLTLVTLSLQIISQINTTDSASIYSCLGDIPELHRVITFKWLSIYYCSFYSLKKKDHGLNSYFLNKHFLWNNLIIKVRNLLYLKCNECLKEWNAILYQLLKHPQTKYWMGLSVYTSIKITVLQDCF